jgi:uncharacterized protein (DUF342 family)
MAFDSDFEQRMSSALEEYRRSDSEMRMNAPGSEPAPRPEEDHRQTSEKKEAVDGSVEITFDPEGNTANMILHKPFNGGRPITPQGVMAELAKKGITTGIDDLDIKDMVEGKVYDTPICIARAIPPKRGENGRISFRFEKQRVPKPKYDEFGIADFRELDLIVPIKKGEVIADITPPTPGEPGLNIFGRAIKPEPGIMPNITVGKNTLMTADGKNIVSACNGHIIYGTGCFNVEDTVTVKSDLDISVGNITFNGDVVIKGNVMEGFSIKAGRSVRIEGTAFSASINAGGNIIINGGAINSQIDCEGDVSIGFCENTTIKSKGKVESAQFAFCDVFCYGELVAKGRTGVITGGKLTCMKDVTAGIIGSEKYTSTEINIGDGSVTCARKRDAEAELASAKTAYSQAAKNVEFLKTRKKRQGGKLTDVQSKQMKTETQNKVFYSVRCKELEELISQLDADLKHRDDLCARVGTAIYPGSHFCINYLSLDVTQVYSRSRVCVVDDEIQVVPL